MKVFFDQTSLVVKPENYAEDIALKKWADEFFKRVDMNLYLDSPYYLLISRDDNELRKSINAPK